MIRVELSRTFPVPVSDAFAFITEPNNWKAFFPNFIQIHDPTHAKWNRPGDRVTVTIRILGRAVDVDMTLEEIQQDARVAYISHQQGLPNARHERLFNVVPGGFDFDLVVSFDPRRGLTGLYDRFVVKPAVTGALRKTIKNLDSIFGQQRSRT